MEACGAAALFDATHLIVAGEHPDQKPAPSIFRTACAALGVPPASTLMVGDSYDADISGAMNAQLLSTVWVRAKPPDSVAPQPDNLRAPPPGKPPPGFTVSSVLEVEAVLQQLK